MNCNKGWLKKSNFKAIQDTKLFRGENGFCI